MEDKNEINWLYWKMKADEPINTQTIRLIVEQMKCKHRLRYGTVRGKSRKTYDCDDLWNDLEFILNHITV